jgi:hypothetical protein
MNDSGHSGEPEVLFEELTRRPLDGPIRCLKCGIEAWFPTPADAHAATWDIAPFFTLQPVCPNCFFGPWAMEFLVS